MEVSLGVCGVAKSDQDVFKAAQSVREGAQRVTDALAEWGSGRTSWRENLQDALASEEAAAIEKATAKLFREVWKTQSPDFRENLKGAKLTPEGRAQAERLIKTETQNFRKRHGRHWANKTTSKITQQDVIYSKLNVLMVRWWVRCGSNGTPGFMFLSNKALTDLLSILLDKGNLEADCVEQTRYRLGLKPASEKKPLIVGAIADHAKAELVFQGRKWTFRDPVTGKITSGDTTCRAQSGQITLCGIRLFPHRRY